MAAKPNSSQQTPSSRLDSESEIEGQSNTAPRGSRANLPDPIARLTNYIKAPKPKRRERMALADSRYKELNNQLEHLQIEMSNMTALLQPATPGSEQPSAPPPTPQLTPSAAPTTKAHKGL